ncbi:hypothetical protein OBK05_13505 [Empedobacter falsenii]
MKKYYIYLVIFSFSTFALSQVGIGTQDPKVTLDVVANSTEKSVADGVLAPRLTGDQLRAKNTAYTQAQNGTLVYVTEAVTGTPTGKTINLTTPGYYYYDQPTSSAGIWRAVANDWKLSGNSGTNSNSHFIGTTDNQPLSFRVNNLTRLYITQAGRLLFYNTSPFLTGFEDVYNHSNLFIGGGNESERGYYNTALGVRSLNKQESTSALGNTAIGFESQNKSRGNTNTSLGAFSLYHNTTGSSNTAIGSNAGVFPPVYGTDSQKNSITTENQTIFIGASTYLTDDMVGKDGLVNIGNLIFGRNVTSVNPNTPVGNIGIGVSAPTTRLHINASNATSDPLRVEGLRVGAATDKILVVDTNGVLKVSNNTLSSSANNGVEVNETNQTFQLGGSLNKATTITTTAEYTLAVAGLQNTTDAGKVTDAFMVVGSTGILKKADIKYSSTEQVTGKKWTDGKAVYERVLEISITGGEVNKITLAEGSRPAKILGMRMISRADNSVTTEISRYDATSGLLVFGSGRTTQYQKTGTYDLVLEYIK